MRARAHVQTADAPHGPHLTCVSLLSNGSLAAYQVQTQSAQQFARYGKRVCTCARADATHPDLCKARIYWAPSHTQNLNAIFPTVCEIWKRGVHVRTCRCTPPQTCRKHLSNGPLVEGGATVALLGRGVGRSKKTRKLQAWVMSVKFLSQTGRVVDTLETFSRCALHSIKCTHPTIGVLVSGADEGVPVTAWRRHLPERDQLTVVKPGWLRTTDGPGHRWPRG